MKTVLRMGYFTFAMLLMVVQSASADQVTYSLNEQGGSGNISGGAPTVLNETVLADIGTYQFTGSVNPAQTGLIGVSSGFRAAVSRDVPGFTPDVSGGDPFVDGGQEPDSNTGGGPPGDFPSTQWTRITIETRAAAVFQTDAQINGLSPTNNVGYIKFDWLVTGTSSLSLNADGFGSIAVNDARSVATIRESGNLSVPDSFIHDPTPGSNGAINDLALGVLQPESFLLPYDVTQLSPGEIPLFEVDFEFAVETRLDVSNVDDLGNFEALFDANFSNTATLTNVSVLDSSGVLIPGASLTDVNTGLSLVASSVPEPSTAVVLVLAGCVTAIRRRRCEA